MKYKSITELKLHDQPAIAPGALRVMFRRGYIIFSDKAEAEIATRKLNNLKIDNFVWMTKLEPVD